MERRPGGGRLGLGDGDGPTLDARRGKLVPGRNLQTFFFHEEALSEGFARVNTAFPWDLPLLKAC